jgi:hypothetical protein
MTLLHRTLKNYPFQTHLAPTCQIRDYGPIFVPILQTEEVESEGGRQNNLLEVPESGCNPWSFPIARKTFCTLPDSSLLPSLAPAYPSEQASSLAVPVPPQGRKQESEREHVLQCLCQLTLLPSLPAANGKSEKVVCFPGSCQPLPAGTVQLGRGRPAEEPRGRGGWGTALLGCKHIGWND